MIDWIVGSCSLILLMFLVRRCLKNRISCRLLYALWGLVVIRLLCPVGFWDWNVPRSETDGQTAGVATEKQTAEWNLDEELEAGEDEWNRFQEASQLDDMSRNQPDSVQIPSNAVKADMEEKNLENAQGMEGQTALQAAGDSPVTGAGEGDRAEIENRSSRFEKDSSNSFEPVFADAKKMAGSLSGWVNQNQQLIRLVWLVGTVAGLLWILFVNLRFFAKLKAVRIRRISREEGRVTDVYEVADLETPCLFGIFSPAIYVTPELIGKPEDLQLVLEHESSHYMHRDQYWVLLRGICVAAWWWNPLVWLAASAMRNDCEMACDERVMERIGWEKRFDYGRVLVDVSSGSHHSSHSLVASTMASEKDDVKGRLRMIMRKTKIHVVSVGLAVVLMIAGTVFCFGENGTRESENGPVVLAASGVYVSPGTKDGVEEFCTIAEIEDSMSIYQVTPECFGEEPPVKLFKDVETGRNWVLQGEEAWNLRSGTENGLLSAALADLDANGVYELYYTYRSKDGRAMLSSFDLDVMAAGEEIVYVVPDGNEPVLGIGEDGELRVFAGEAATGQQSWADYSIAPGVVVSGIHSEELVAYEVFWTQVKDTVNLTYQEELSVFGWQPPLGNNSRDVIWGMSPEQVLPQLPDSEWEMEETDSSTTYIFNDLLINDWNADLCLEFHREVGLIQVRLEAAEDCYQKINEWMNRNCQGTGTPVEISAFENQQVQSGLRWSGLLAERLLDSMEITSYWKEAMESEESEYEGTDSLVYAELFRKEDGEETDRNVVCRFMATESFAYACRKSYESYVDFVRAQTEEVRKQINSESMSPDRAWLTRYENGETATVALAREEWMKIWQACELAAEKWIPHSGRKSLLTGGWQIRSSQLTGTVEFRIGKMFVVRLGLMEDGSGVAEIQRIDENFNRESMTLLLQDKELGKQLMQLIYGVDFNGGNENAEGSAESVDTGNGLLTLAASGTYVSSGSKEGVEEFCKLAGIRDSANVYCVTPEIFGENPVVEIYKDTVECVSWISYEGAYQRLKKMNEISLISAALADLDENGIYEFYYTYKKKNDNTPLLDACDLSDMNLIGRSEGYLMDVECVPVLGIGEDGELRVYSGELNAPDNSITDYAIAIGEAASGYYTEELVKYEAHQWKITKNESLMGGVLTEIVDVLPLFSFNDYIFWGMDPEIVLTQCKWEPAEIRADGDYYLYRFRNVTVNDIQVDAELAFHSDAGLVQIRLDTQASNYEKLMELRDAAQNVPVETIEASPSVGDEFVKGVRWGSRIDQLNTNWKENYQEGVEQYGEDSVLEDWLMYTDVVLASDRTSGNEYAVWCSCVSLPMAYCSQSYRSGIDEKVLPVVTEWLADIENRGLEPRRAKVYNYNYSIPFTERELSDEQMNVLWDVCRQLTGELSAGSYYFGNKKFLFGIPQLNEVSFWLGTEYVVDIVVFDAGGGKITLEHVDENMVRTKAELILAGENNTSVLWECIRQIIVSAAEADSVGEQPLPEKANSAEESLPAAEQSFSGETGSSVEQSLPVLASADGYQSVGTKDGVEEFCQLAGLKDSTNIYQVTPEMFGEELSVRIFKDCVSGMTWIRYQDSFLNLRITEASGLTSAALADLNSDGCYEFYYMYPGSDGAVLSYVDLSRMENGKKAEYAMEDGSYPLLGIGEGGELQAFAGTKRTEADSNTDYVLERGAVMAGKNGENLVKYEVFWSQIQTTEELKDSEARSAERTKWQPSIGTGIYAYWGMMPEEILVQLEDASLEVAEDGEYRTYLLEDTVVYGERADLYLIFHAQAGLVETKLVMDEDCYDEITKKMAEQNGRGGNTLLSSEMFGGEPKLADSIVRGMYWSTDGYSNLLSGDLHTYYLQSLEQYPTTDGEEETLIRAEIAVIPTGNREWNPVDGAAESNDDAVESTAESSDDDAVKSTVKGANESPVENCTVWHYRASVPMALAFQKYRNQQMEEILPVVSEWIGEIRSQGLEPRRMEAQIRSDDRNQMNQILSLEERKRIWEACEGIEEAWQPDPVNTMALSSMSSEEPLAYGTVTMYFGTEVRLSVTVYRQGGGIVELWHVDEEFNRTIVELVLPKNAVSGEIWEELVKRMNS